MEEYQVTVDGITHALPQPFIVLATQTPVSLWAPIPCPRRRWTAFSCVFPSAIQRGAGDGRAGAYSGQVKPMETLEPVCSAQDIILLQQMVTTIYCAPEVRAYVAQLVAATRQDPACSWAPHPCGHRADSWRPGMRAADGRDFILPEDVQHMVLLCFPTACCPTRRRG